MARSSRELPAASRCLRAGSHPASCFPFSFHFWPLWKAKSFTIHCNNNCSFRKDFFYFCSPQPISPSAGWHHTFREKSSLPVIWRCRRSLPQGSHRESITKGSYVITQRLTPPSHHNSVVSPPMRALGFWGLPPNRMAWFCFLVSDESNVFSLSTSNKGCLPGKASAAQGTAG